MMKVMAKSKTNGVKLALMKTSGLESQMTMLTRCAKPLLLLLKLVNVSKVTFQLESKTFSAKSPSLR